MPIAATAKQHRTLKYVGITLAAPQDVGYDRRTVRAGRVVFTLLQAVGQRGIVSEDAAKVAVWGDKAVSPVLLRNTVYRLNSVLEKLACPARVGQFRGNLLLTY